MLVHIIVIIIVIVDVIDENPGGPSEFDAIVFVVRSIDGRRRIVLREDYHLSSVHHTIDQLWRIIRFVYVRKYGNGQSQQQHENKDNQ